MKILMGLKTTVATLFLATATTALASAPDATGVVRETLPNGLRVVIIRNTLAPVVTVEINFMVGGNETPAGFPGSAHALEHMAFRGCEGMTADQTSAIYAQLGGQNNADTQQNITQFYATVPSADVNVALQAQASCLRGVDVAPAEWAQEKGAIIQEVQRDLSNPTYKFISRLNEDMFAGTPYAHDPLGTRDSFEKTTAESLSNFYKQWYTPGNAILVIVGDVEPATTMAKVKELFGSIKDHPLPARPAVTLGALKQETFTLNSNLPYVLGFIAYRMPGTQSPDFAAAQILSDVLASQRADLYGMVPAGKALAAEFGVAETYPKASVGYGVVALPSGADATAAIAEMRSILARYAERGVPEELVAAAKRSEVAQAEFQRNSIPGLAEVWSAALAAEGRQSPDEDVAAALYEETEAAAGRHGLAQYEISNYAAPGAESRHNLAYWRYQDYAGIGPGAHGRLTLGGALFATARHRAPEIWAGLVEEKGSGATLEEAISPRDRGREALLMGLRLSEGIGFAAFVARTGISLLDALDPQVLEQALAEDYLLQTPTHLIATAEGRKRLDALLPELAR